MYFISFIMAFLGEEKPQNPHEIDKTKVRRGKSDSHSDGYAFTIIMYYQYPENIIGS